MSLDLLSSTSRVEIPYISVTIADTTFGSYSSESRNIIGANGIYKEILTKYPNFMDSLTITKVNGTLNSYSLVLKYAITQNDDPNLLEKIFSKASKTRKIKLSYGDLSIPSYVYKEEEAIITDIRSNVDINSSCITYTLSCVSSSLALSAGTYSFQKIFAKPSDQIKKLLYDSRYGLLEVFYGMINKEKVLQAGLIASDDKPVTIEAKKSISPINYLNYLVSCMCSNSDTGDNLIKNSNYNITVYDDINNEWSGPYFKVRRIDTSIADNSLDTYEINIGYPDNNYILNFNIDDNQTYSILYDYAGEIKQSNYIYRINNNGEIEYDYSPVLSNSKTLLKTTEANKTWWTNVTQFPISATLTIKGLLKPAILMTYVKLNVLFFGRPHVSSGYYIVTEQVDNINSSGYTTTLKLTRIKNADPIPNI